MIHLDVADGHVAVSPIYARARSAAWRLCSSPILAGSGTLAVTGSACSGEVPQVTIGTMSLASSVTSHRTWRLYLNEGSSNRLRQLPNAHPLVAGLPFT